MTTTSRLHLTQPMLLDSAKAIALVFATSVPLFLIGQSTLGGAVIGLSYLLPVIWAAYHWGRAAGMSAALAAALCFDFLFIPPFFTFAVGSLEGWLVLAIFMSVAVLVVGRIHASLRRAQEAVFMYELSEALSGLRTRDAVAHTLARFIQRMYQTDLVSVIYHISAGSPSVVVCEPPAGVGRGRPSLVIPILNAWGLIGEIQIWKGEYSRLPSADSRLLQNFGSQAGRALERTQQLEREGAAGSPAPRSIQK